MSGSNRSRTGIAVLCAGLLALTATIVVTAQRDKPDIAGTKLAQADPKPATKD